MNSSMIKFSMMFACLFSLLLAIKIEQSNAAESSNNHLAENSEGIINIFFLLAKLNE
jgi:hypothetical protein